MKMRLGKMKNGIAAGRHETNQQETGKRAVKVIFHHARSRDPRLYHVTKNGPAESFTLLGIQQRLKLRLDFILDDVKGCAVVASTLNRLNQSGLCRCVRLNNS